MLVLHSAYEPSADTRMSTLGHSKAFIGMICKHRPGRSGRVQKISPAPAFDARTKNNITEGHMETRLQFRGAQYFSKKKKRKMGGGATSGNFTFSNIFQRCATNRKVAGSIQDGVIGIFH